MGCRSHIPISVLSQRGNWYYSQKLEHPCLDKRSAMPPLRGFQVGGVVGLGARDTWLDDVFYCFFSSRGFVLGKAGCVRRLTCLVVDKWMDV